LCRWGRHLWGGDANCDGGSWSFSRESGSAFKEGQNGSFVGNVGSEVIEGGVAVRPQGMSPEMIQALGKV